MPDEYIDESALENNPTGSSLAFSLVLAVCVFTMHTITRGPVYFADEHFLLQAIQDGTYVIQPPGYWLYARIGGLFHNPSFGFAFLNLAFASAGAVAFYFLCGRLGIEERISRLASVAYSSVFFVYFSGDIHSVYSSQILFPPLLVLTFLHYGAKRTPGQLVICAATFALGTGFRPSDGVFLLPLFSYLVFRTEPRWKVRFQFFLTYGILCLFWLVPNQIALADFGIGDQLGPLAVQASILLAGVTQTSIANILRVLVPLSIAFWPLMIAVPYVSRERMPLLLLWAIPGLLFLMLIYMGQAPYLVFLSGAAILAAALCQRRKLAVLVLAICMIWNLGFYFLAKPLAGTGKVTLVYNYYAVQFTYFGVAHQWNQVLAEALVSGPWYENR